MTPVRNTPVGWAAFRALRQTPAPMFVRRHGNWRHGAFAKASIASRLEFRWATAVLNGRSNGPPPWAESTPAPGWAAYRAGR